MSKRNKIHAITVVIWLYSGAALAVDDPLPAQPAEQPGSWKGHADLGYSDASGNSETQNLNAAFGVEYLTGLWTHSLDLTALRAKDSGDTNAERYKAEAKTKYALSDVSYVFGDVIHERDEFGGVRKRTSETVGYGRKLFHTDAHSLEAEIGIGARQSELQDGTEEDEAIVRIAADYQRKLSESAGFNQQLLIEAGDSNTYVESVSELKMAVTGSVFAKLGYTVKYNDSVPAGIENTDKYTTVSLAYEF